MKKSGILEAADLFCGAGGTTTGAEMSGRVKVVLAVILLIWLIYSLLPYSGMGGGLHTLPCR